MIQVAPDQPVTRAAHGSLECGRRNPGPFGRQGGIPAGMRADDRAAIKVMTVNKLRFTSRSVEWNRDAGLANIRMGIKQ